MKKLDWKWLFLGSLSAYVMAYIVEQIAYNTVFIPSIRGEFARSNESFLQADINFGPGGLTVQAPLAFRDVCASTYYGCFDWAEFPGADVVVAFHGVAPDKVAIVAQRECSNERCVELVGFNAMGYFVNGEEFGEISKDFHTEVQCKNSEHRYLIKYKVEICSTFTVGYGNIVSETRFARVQNLLTLDFFPSSSYKVYFQAIANYATKKVYLREGW